MTHTPDTLSKYGAKFQTKVLTVLLSDFTYLKLVHDMVSKEYFDSNANQWVVNKTVNHFEKYKIAPTKDVLEIESKEIDNDVLSKEVSIELKKIYSHIDDLDQDYIKDEFLTFVKNQTMKKAILDSVDLLSYGDYDTIKKKVDDAIHAGEVDDIGLDALEDIVEVYTDKVIDKVLTGWPIIDEILDGGMRPGGIYFVAGPPGSGKSWSLVNFMVNAFKKGKTAVYYSLEMDREDVVKRSHAVLTGISYKDLKYHQDDIKEELLKYKGKMIVQDYGSGTAPITKLRAHVEKLKLGGEKPGLLIIDYADLLKLPRKKAKHEELEELVVDLRGMAKELGIPIVTASQINREHAEDEEIGGTGLAGSFSKLMTADFVMSLSRLAKDKLGGTARYHIVKNRVGPDGMTFNSQANLSNGRIDIYAPNTQSSADAKASMEQGEINQKANLIERYRQMQDAKKNTSGSKGSGLGF